MKRVHKEPKNPEILGKTLGNLLDPSCLSCILVFYPAVIIQKFFANNVGAAPKIIRILCGYTTVHARHLGSIRL